MHGFRHSELLSQVAGGSGRTCRIAAASCVALDIQKTIDVVLRLFLDVNATVRVSKLGI